FGPSREGYESVTWLSHLSLVMITDISAFWGLIMTPITDYAEPAARCAHFLADPAITNTFRARTYQAAEEETDTLVALDIAFHDFKIIFTATSVVFYIDDVVVATHVTQIPNAQMVTEYLMRTEAAAAKTMQIQNLSVEIS
ncbi:unnamed protein product, partial [marine sediment metagenome]